MLIKKEEDCHRCLIHPHPFHNISAFCFEIKMSYFIRFWEKRWDKTPPALVGLTVVPRKIQETLMMLKTQILGGYVSWQYPVDLKYH